MNVQRIIYNKQTFRINILGILENFLSIDCSCKFSPNYLIETSWKIIQQKYSFEIFIFNLTRIVKYGDWCQPCRHFCLIKYSSQQMRGLTNFYPGPGRLSEGARGGDNSYFSLI